MLSLSAGIEISSPGGEAEDAFARRDLESSFRAYGVRPLARNAAVEICLLRRANPVARRLLVEQGLRFDSEMRDEGYVITSRGPVLYVIAETSAGIFYGAQTVKQLVDGYGRAARLQLAIIRDWPAMKFRGVDDDLSRGPMPSLEFQEKQIRIFAAYKINIYSPYFENTFQYAASPLAAPPGGALTRAEAGELVRYARQYHVTIVPEQESFGHLSRVLAYDRFLPLGEVPHGSVLAPGQPGSLELIRSWFGELAEVFPGPFVHIGADETFELGRGQSAAAVARDGLGAVYVDFLSSIARELAPLRKKILFWGDVAMNSPLEVKRLPKDLIAVPWWYSPEEEGYTKFIAPFRDAQLETWVAPGISNWNLVYPNNDTALRNIQGFVRDGQKLGSTGTLITVWNDDGESLFEGNWYGVLFGAAASWQAGESDIAAYQASFGRVFHRDWSGKIDRAQRELIAAQLDLNKVKIEDANDQLFWLDPWTKDGQQMTARIRPLNRGLREHAELALELVEEAREENPHLSEEDALSALELGARRIDFIGQKFEYSDEMAESYAAAYREHDPRNDDQVGALLEAITGGHDGRCQQLRDGYTLLGELYQQAWRRERRPFWMENVLVRYNLATELWQTRCSQLQQVFDDRGATHSLPKAEDLGVPDPASVGAPRP